MLYNVELVEEEGPGLCEEVGLVPRLLGKVLCHRLQSRRKEKVPCHGHLVRRLGVDSLVDQVLHDPEEMPGQCWESLWEEGSEKLGEEADMHDVCRG